MPERADAWSRKADTARFVAGASALDRMIGGQLADLLAVWRHLDAEQDGEA